MTMLKREAFVIEDTVAIIEKADREVVIKNYSRCRHKLGTVNGMCLTCGQILYPEDMNYNNNMR